MFGATTYTVKRRIGCTLKITRASIKFMNPFLNIIAKFLIFIESSWVGYRYPVEGTDTHEKESPA